MNDQDQLADTTQVEPAGEHGCVGTRQQARVVEDGPVPEHLEDHGPRVAHGVIDADPAAEREGPSLEVKCDRAGRVAADAAGVALPSDRPGGAEEEEGQASHG